MKRFTTALVGVVLFAASFAVAQQIPAIARAQFETYLTDVANAPFPNRSLSGFAYNGRNLMRMVIDTTYIIGSTGALTCTLDFNRDIYYPFVCASKDTNSAGAILTWGVKLMNEYGDRTPTSFSVSGETLAHAFPTFAQRYIFTVASADTIGGIKFFVTGFGIPVYSR